MMAGGAAGMMAGGAAGMMAGGAAGMMGMPAMAAQQAMIQQRMLMMQQAMMQRQLMMQQMMMKKQLESAKAALQQTQEQLKAAQAAKEAEEAAKKRAEEEAAAAAREKARKVPWPGGLVHACNCWLAGVLQMACGLAWVAWEDLGGSRAPASILRSAAQHLSAFFAVLLARARSGMRRVRWYRPACSAQCRRPTTRMAMAPTELAAPSPLAGRARAAAGALAAAVAVAVVALAAALVVGAWASGALAPTAR